MHTPGYTSKSNEIGEWHLWSLFLKLHSLRRKWGIPVQTTLLQKKKPLLNMIQSHYYWIPSQKWQNDLSLFPRQTIQYHWNLSLCPYQKCWRNWSWTVLWKTTRPSRTNTQKRCPYRGLECKSRKSRNTWSNGQIWPWSTEWSRAKANRVLPRECTGHSEHRLPTTQEKTLHMDITRWSRWE